MAKCEICGREMTTADGCSVSKVFINGIAYERIKCGDDLDFDPFMEEGERCHDCGALVGHYHHWGAMQSDARLAMSSSLAVNVTFILRRWSRYESTNIYDFGLDEIDAMLRQ